MTVAVLDEGVPAEVADILSTDRLPVTRFPDEWRSRTDGDVLDLASKVGFDWLITCDKRMAFQQNLTGRSVSVLVMPSARLPLLRQLVDDLRLILENPVPGHFVRVDEKGRMAGEPATHIQGRRIT